MALSKQIILDNGAVVSYHVITSISTDLKNNQQQFMLESFIDKAVYDSNPDGWLDAFVFTLSGTNNTLESAYVQAMTYDKYSGASEV